VVVAHVLVIFLFQELVPVTAVSTICCPSRRDAEPRPHMPRCDAQEILTMSIDDVRQQIFHIYQLVKFMLCKPIAQNCGRYFDHCVPK